MLGQVGSKSRWRTHIVYCVGSKDDYFFFSLIHSLTRSNMTSFHPCNSIYWFLHAFLCTASHLSAHIQTYSHLGFLRLRIWRWGIWLWSCPYKTLWPQDLQIVRLQKMCKSSFFHSKESIHNINLDRTLSYQAIRGCVRPAANVPFNVIVITKRTITDLEVSVSLEKKTSHFKVF